MAALLVALGVMAIMMTVAMPVWRQTAQREKEQELLFRGQQYAHAIGLFERKYANTPPPTLDVLVQERFLRKKYQDPITHADFVVIPGGAITPAASNGAPAAQSAGTGAGTGTPVPGITSGATVAQGGIIGVTSASKERSLRVYNGGTHYNEWRFVYTPAVATPGATPAGQGQRGPGGQNPTGGAGRGGPGRGGPVSGGAGTPAVPDGRSSSPAPPAGPFGRGR